MSRLWERCSQDLLLDLSLDRYGWHTFGSEEAKLRAGITNVPVINFVDTIFSRAIIMHASDIHFVPGESQVRVRFRIDGLLYEQEYIDLSFAPSVISRIKLLAGIDIGERRLPQDGTLRLLFYPEDMHGRSLHVDVRAATFPSVYGELLVLRLLHVSKNILKLSHLGFEAGTCAAMQKQVASHKGFFIVTGSTGSGKTTTLYTLLNDLDKSKYNVITMEDPVEYHIAGVIQSQVNTKAGFVFENGLRAILRQDPDVIMIGEMRDFGSARIAIEAALTGHLVLSTAHAKNAVGVITRLLQMGIENYLIAEAISGVLAQVLLRRLCGQCKYEDAVSYKESCMLHTLALSDIKTAWRASGCATCFNLGHHGRIAAGELLLMTDDVRASIIQNNEIVYSKLCTRTLRDAVVEHVKSGIVGLQELLMLLSGS